MSNHYTAKVAESLKLRGWIDEIQAKALRADNARLESNLATYKAAVAEAREALEKWKAYYEAQLDDCDKEITRYTKEQDFHGVNFHQGRRAGIIQHDVGLQPLKNLAATLNSLLGDKCGVKPT